MTLGEGKRKVLMLLDEYSSGGATTEDRDIDAKMTDFFDLAQKNVANIKRIVRAWIPAEVESTAPADFISTFRVWRDGKMTKKYRWRGKTIFVPEEDVGKVEVEYFAAPATIWPETPDNYEFDVSDDAAQCLPYFVAAQQLVTDLILDPAPLMALYDRMLAGLDLRLPSSGGGGVVQALYAAPRRRVP